jgi:hypothetical protein
MGESQPGQVPLHRIRQWIMPPPTNQIQVAGFMSFRGNPSGKPGRLNASPHEGAWRNPPSQDSDMKLEDAGSPRWGTECANYWPPFMSLRPSLWLLWVALTQLSWFFLRTLSFGSVIPGFYAKTEYSLYAWPRINCSTHTAKNAHR